MIARWPSAMLVGACLGAQAPMLPPESSEVVLAVRETAVLKRLSVHPLAKFDEGRFLRLLRHSPSLSVPEKLKVLRAVPTLSQFQIDELTKIFENEALEFLKLSTAGKERETIVIGALRRKADRDWAEVVRTFLADPPPPAAPAEPPSR